MVIQNYCIMCYYIQVLLNTWKNYELNGWRDFGELMMPDIPELDFREMDETSEYM